MRVLIMIDAFTLPYLRQGEPPAAPFSHDKNLFQFAHEALRKGLTVVFTAVQEDAITRPYFLVNQIYPTWEQQEQPIGYGDVAPDIVVAVFPEALNIRRHFPHPKIVAIHAAIHWVESPERFPAQYVFDVITAVRYNVDFILTQTVRMAELLSTMYGLLAKWPYRDRIIISPLGIVEEERRGQPDRAAVRTAMGLRDGDIAIINSGGTWRWTDFNTFLRAFGEFMEAEGGPLKLFVMGLVQPTNSDHDEYLAETEQLIHRFRGLLGKSLLIDTDWIEAGKVVKSYSACADLGLNVNLPSLENWQSYRLRFLDYMYFGVPVLNTSGDIITDETDARHAIVVRSGDVESYKSAFRQIVANPGILTEAGDAMRALAAKYDSRLTYGCAIDQILAMPRRPLDDYSTWGDCVLDYARKHTEEQQLNKILTAVKSLIS